MDDFKIAQQSVEVTTHFKKLLINNQKKSNFFFFDGKYMKYLKCMGLKLFMYLQNTRQTPTLKMIICIIYDGN